MGKRITGGLFCLASSILFSSRYIAAAIHVSEKVTNDKKIFLSSLSFVGTPLLIFSIIFLVVGVLYLISAELDKSK